MRGFPYLPISAAAVFLALLLSPIRLHASAKQTGFSARLTLMISLLFGLIRLSLRFVIEFDAEKARQDPLEIKNALSFFKLTKSGELLPIKQKKPQKPRAEKLSISPLLGAFRLKKLAVKGSLALEGAAACALLCGALSCTLKPLLTLAAELSPINARKAAIEAEFLPKFNEASTSTAFEGILETNSAKLIKGGISALSKKAGKSKRRAQRPLLREKTAKNIRIKEKNYASH